MLTHKYIQLIGNMAANNLVRRYPDLDIKFFSGKRGDMMRVYIIHRDDDRQLTGRLFDVEINPGIETRWVKTLADRIEGKMHEAVKNFLGVPKKEAQADSAAPPEAKTLPDDDTKPSAPTGDGSAQQAPLS